MDLWPYAVKAIERSAAGGRARERTLQEIYALAAQVRPCPPPLPRPKWTRRVPHPVLIGHAASLTPY